MGFGLDMDDWQEEQKAKSPLGQVWTTHVTETADSIGAMKKPTLKAGENEIVVAEYSSALSHNGK
ncbi:MAG: hypothetical protein CBB87_08835 [Micavibrio sp. TMED27]|nr:hypothetical protein [Micavibrio sp.]OUT90765.1 MAG: hypothetical protein CBB87_08835 [Micavibrio sp. TMED27]|tara:strand:+ start:3878 stop:4072 length:195 start_codon:yes stop_codon:yes gene_type:complete